MNILGLFFVVFAGLFVSKGIFNFSDMACAIGAVVGAGSFILMRLNA